MARPLVIKLALISIVVQLLMFAYDEYSEHRHNLSQFEETHLALMRGDAHSYYEPIESWLATGEYQSNSLEAGYSKFGRAPYYGLFYGFFRLFFDRVHSLDAVILLQLVLKMIANVVFFRLALLITKSEKTAWIAFLTFTFSALASLHIDRIMTESISFSFFIFGLCFFFRWNESQQVRHLLIAGLFIGFIMCMRPFLVPVSGVFISVFILRNRRSDGIVKSLRNLVLFFVPFVLLLSPWAIRNYIISGKVILFQESVNAGYSYSKADLSLRYFLTATGESFLSWDYDAAGSWFDPGFVKYSHYRFSNSMCSPSVTKEKIEFARAQYMKSLTDADSTSGAIADSMFRVMRQQYIDERPFAYYVIAPLKITKNAFVHNGMELLYRETWYQLVYKILQSGLFVVISIGFVFSLVIPRISQKDYLWIIPLGLILVLCVGFRFCERRYFLYAYPVFMLYTSALVSFLLSKFRAAKQ